MSVARILIVEDNPANLALMDFLLRAFGYAPLQARDGAEGVAVAGREQPDLILMDIQLPKITGIEALKQIRAVDSRPHERDTTAGAGTRGSSAGPPLPDHSTGIPRLHRDRSRQR
jgi:CheY-like chemotaxis protein